MDNNSIHKHYNRSTNASGNIRTAFFLNLFFTIFEIVGGLLTNSMAILSDALHDFGDSLSLGIAWYFEKYSEKAPDKHFTFGYSRFSLLGAIVNSIVLVCGSLLILSRSIPRIFHPEGVYPEGMLLIAIVGIIINGTAVLKLKRGHSLNEKVVSWHLLEDLLGWIAVFFASIILIFIDIPIIDPILSVLITIYVLYNVVKNLREIFIIMLQGVPKEFSIDVIENEMTGIDNVLSVHHTHIWTLEGENHMLSSHVVIRNEAGRDEMINIKNSIRKLMKKKGIDHVTIELEFESEG